MVLVERVQTVNLFVADDAPESADFSVREGFTLCVRQSCFATERFSVGAAYGQISC
jgi:hypothetical protein